MTTVELRIPEDIHTRLLADITKSGEWAGYLLCGILHNGDQEILLGREWIPVPIKYQIPNTGHGFTWHPDFDVQMLNRIQRDYLSAAVLHYHGGSSPTLGASSDRQTARSLMPFLSWEAPGRSHMFGVLGDHAGSGSIFRDGNETGDLGALRVSGSWLDDWSVGRKKRKYIVTARQDRMVRGFGELAFQRLRSATVGVVGCGGGGSHVIQQLSYLGVGSLVLVDADRVEETNLNRLIGAVPARTHLFLKDRIRHRGLGDIGRLKIDVMKRLVDSINESIEVRKFPVNFPTRETVAALRKCDIIIACVDRLQVRDDLNRLAKRYLIPLIDIGLEITPVNNGVNSVKSIPGRVTKVLANGPCLRCQGVISDTKLAADRNGKPIGYTGLAQIPDPAIVTLNGIISSIATTEVLQLLTGFAGHNAPNCGWIYDGLLGITERVEKSVSSCNACREERALGDPESQLSGNNLG